jgi:hypothetical protein
MALRTLPESYQDTGFCDVRVALDGDAIIVATQDHPAMYFRHGTWETLIVKHRDKVAFNNDFNFSVTKKPTEANENSISPNTETHIVQRFYGGDQSLVAFDKDFNILGTIKLTEANEISTILMDCNNLINQAADLRAKLEEMRERLGVEL